MRWKDTEKLYNDYWNVMFHDSPNKIDYESFVQAMLSDLHMVVESRSSIDSESEFILFAFTHFPQDSEAFEWAKKIIALRYYGNDKNEFIACFKRDDAKQSNLLYRQRAEIEYNPEYIQLVAMAVPYILEPNSPPIFVFVQESRSDLAGHTTMIGGHVRYEGTNQVSWLDNQCVNTAFRESVEELGVNPDAIKYTPDNFPYKECLKETGNKLGYITFDIIAKSEETSISYYHIGRCYPFQIDSRALFEAKLEEGKELLLYSVKPVPDTVDIRNRFNKKMTIFTPETFNMEKFKPDSWLTLFINLIRGFEYIL